MEEREKLVRMLLEKLSGLPDFLFFDVIERLLYTIDQALLTSKPHFDLIVNVNETPHHDIHSALMRQFTFSEYIPLTEGTLSLSEMLKIPEDILTSAWLREAWSLHKIGVVLTGHPIMQFLTVGTLLSSLGRITVLVWTGEKYLPFELRKFTPPMKLVPTPNHCNIISPLSPFVFDLIDELRQKGFNVCVVCERIEDEDDWVKCLKKTLEMLIGNKKAWLLMDAPSGIPAIAGVVMVECLSQKITLLTFEEDQPYIIQADHKNFREALFTAHKIDLDEV